MQEYKVDEILDGLRNRNANVLDYVYQNYFEQIKNFINKNSGSDEDAQDIYQDAVLVIYQKIKKDNLTLTCSFNTYLYSVCRLLWLKQLEKRKKSLEFVENADNVVELTDATFQSEVLESDQAVLVDFWAPWCGPCKMMGPTIDALAEENANVKVCKLNTDENQETPGKYGIQGIPTLIVFKGGQDVTRFVGVTQKEEIQAALDQAG